MIGAPMPEDDTYWAELQARVVEAGTPIVEGYRAHAPPFMSKLSSAAPALAASAILAVIGSWALGRVQVGGQGFLESAEAGVVSRVLTPHDPLAEALAAPEPPYVGRFIMEQP